MELYEINNYIVYGATYGVI